MGGSGVNRKRQPVQAAPDLTPIPEEERPYDIPSDWIWTRVGNVHDVVTGSTPPKKDPKFFSEYGIPFFKPTDLDQGRWVTGASEYLSDEGSDVLRRIPSCSTMICCIGSIGKSAYYDGEAATNQQINSLISHKSVVDPLFTYYYSLTPMFQQTLIHEASATTISIVNKSKLSALPFPVPPLDEQRRIVERIESLLGKIEEVKSDILYARETFSSRRASILSKAFCGELTDGWRAVNPNTETGDCLAQRLMQAKKLSSSNYDCDSPFDIPGTWKWMRFGDIFHVQVGSTPSRKVDEYWGGDNLWVSSGEVAFTRISDTKEKVTDKGVVESRLKLAPERSILFAMIGEGKTRGQVAIAEKPVYHNQNVASIWVNEVDSEYVYYWLVSQYLNNRAIGSGNNQPAYNKSRVEDLLIPLPPVDEQHELVRVINSFLTLDDQVVELLEMDDDIQNMKNSILSEAFSGGL